jgi:hypothetical protein
MIMFSFQELTIRCLGTHQASLATRPRKQFNLAASQITLGRQTKAAKKRICFNDWVKGNPFQIGICCFPTSGRQQNWEMLRSASAYLKGIGIKWVLPLSGVSERAAEQAGLIALNRPLPSLLCRQLLDGFVKRLRLSFGEVGTVRAVAARQVIRR